MSSTWVWMGWNRHSKDGCEFVSYCWYIFLLPFSMPYLFSTPCWHLVLDPEQDSMKTRTNIRLYTWQMPAISCGSILCGLLFLEKKNRTETAQLAIVLSTHFFRPKDIWLILQLALAVVITECLLHKLWHVQNVKILISAAAIQVENWKSLNRKLANICSVTSQACGVLFLPWTTLRWPSIQGMQLFTTSQGKGTPWLPMSQLFNHERQGLK